MWAEDFKLYELWECTICDATAQSVYEADPDDVEYCDECGEAHHLGEITETVMTEPREYVIVEQECVECHETVELEYTFDYREVPSI